MKSLNTTRTYDSELAALGSRHHGRNAVLLRLALLGLAAGRDPDTLTEEIIAAGGEPRLTDQEVRRAVEKALTIRGNGVSTWRPSRQRQKKRAEAPTVGEKRKNFVPWMIKEGGGEAHLEDLMALSKPGNILTNVLAQDKLYYFGEAVMKRTRDRLMTPSEFAYRLAAGEKMPTYFIPNPLSGKSVKNDKGEDSYVGDSLIVEPSLAVVEFDHLPIEKQAAFWLGAIRTKMLPIASLVYSGNKSIHGLIRVNPNHWEEEWAKIKQLMASSDMKVNDDYIYRCDTNCCNKGRMTRLPGAIRPDNGKRQQLLYLGE